MKNLRLTVLTLALVAFTAFSAAAQTKVATVDMKKLFNGYWKTKSSQTILENSKAELRKEINDMADGLRTAQTNYQQLLDQANDSAISADEREKRKQAATDKAKEINTSKASIQQFQQQAETKLADQSQRMSANLVADIQKVVTDKAKAGGFALVLDSTAPGVVFSDSSTDITDQVIKQLNVGAPIDVTKPSGGLPLTISTNVP
jgi:outer membrane protein